MIPYIKIGKDSVIVNGESISIACNEENNWKKNLYQHLELNYPKFFKMDELSKISVLSIEFLKRSINVDAFSDNEIHLIFANKSSSTLADNEYKSSLEKGAPSPSLFVYTLPNICTGEIAISNKWYGSSCFYIADELNELPLQDLIEIEREKGAKASIIGWVEQNDDDDDLGFFTFIEGELNQEELDYITRKIIDNV